MPDKMITNLNAYLHFDGTCEEAFNFYQESLGGDFQVLYRYDHPVITMEGIDKQKILHAEYRLSPAFMFYGCDFYPNRSVVKGNAEPALSLTFDSEAEASEAFEKIKVGGVVLLPFAKQFWGALHGQVIDRFGIKWMMNK
jgi:PhnB protein